MAFRGGRRSGGGGSKEVKKLSYYVWFLGAKESKGLRGEEYIQPVLHYLLEKEKEWEPMKVTLQVSNKGMKIIQNVPRRNAKGKTEQIKHFIPHHAITCVYQDAKPNDDIVCCILLIYNPLTRCPVHVHTYRCDSVETATTLKQHLQILIERPENQKKFREIENRLAAKGLLPSPSMPGPRHGGVSSDGRSTRTDGSGSGSDRTEDLASEASAAKKDNIASLYDSLAQELRERLNNPNSCPILLPPKDYDTISRKQGRLDGIEMRRSTNMNLVGLNKLLRRRDLAANNKESDSSGIGSDEALSSAIQEVSLHPDFEQKEVDPDTSSDDDDWPDPSSDVAAEWRKPPSLYRVVGSPSPKDDFYAGLSYRPPERRSSPGRERALSPAADPRRVSRDPRHYQDSPSPVGKEMRHRDLDLASGQLRTAKPFVPRGAGFQLPEIPNFNGRTSRNAEPEADIRLAAAYHKKRPRGPRSASPGSCYAPRVAAKSQSNVARTSSSPDKYYSAARSNSPDLYPPDALAPHHVAVERQPALYRSEETTRRSGYFDLPVDSADYRHGFVESPFGRRLQQQQQPLHSQY